MFKERGERGGVERVWRVEEDGGTTRFEGGEMTCKKER